MKRGTKIKLLLAGIFLLLIIAAVFVLNQLLVLQKAHSTFENYYAFRGCAELLSTTTDSGTCRTASGQIIKIVEFKNKWYLDGDLPYPGLNFL